MEFIGSAGWPAPRLHDASLSSEEMEAAYIQTCVALRAMFSRCKLVHGDYSEYNLLWFNSEVVVIDVSQSRGVGPSAGDRIPAEKIVVMCRTSSPGNASAFCPSKLYMTSSCAMVV